jgi:hypothetical protein
VLRWIIFAAVLVGAVAAAAMVGRTVVRRVATIDLDIAPRRRARDRRRFWRSAAIGALVFLATTAMADPAVGIAVAAAASLAASMAFAARDASSAGLETPEEARERWANAATALDRLSARAPGAMRSACGRAARACAGIAGRLPQGGEGDRRLARFGRVHLPRAVALLAGGAAVVADAAVSDADRSAAVARARRLADLLERLERRVARRRAEGVALDGEVLEAQIG